MKLYAYDMNLQPLWLPVSGHCGRGDLLAAACVCAGLRPVAVLAGSLLLAAVAWVGGFVLETDAFLHGVLVMAVLAVTALIWGLFIAPRHCLAVYGRKRTQAGERTVQVRAEGLDIEMPDARCSKDWAEFTGWREGWGCFVLLLPDGKFEFIPTRFLGGRRDRAAFRQLLRRHIPAR